MNEVTIRGATAPDFDRVVQLLEQAHLPLAGVAEHFSNFLVAESDGTVVGAIGLELYGATALLRSAVVHPSWRNKGVGSLLYETLLRNATTNGIRRLILRTNTAEMYFARKGFKPIPLASVSGPITMSAEFNGVCNHAVCMELLIGVEP
jgi:amino-acid N-acetyltransferase